MTEINVCAERLSLLLLDIKMNYMNDLNLELIQMNAILITL